MQADLKRAVDERRAQYALFAAWEDQQRSAPADVRRRIGWYSDALELARRTGGTGRNASESHLHDLISWVQRWRRAWRAE